MGEMVSLEKFFCRSAPWRRFARKVVLPWALQGVRPTGHALEIGAGSGMMAVELLDSFPHLKLTVTDFDAAMLDKSRSQLEGFGSRVELQTADATSLSFPDGSFDYVFSFIMLHHVIEWEKAISEVVRVLRPGGWLVGYDVLDSRIFRFLHRIERAEIRLMPWDELDSLLSTLPIDRVELTGAGRRSSRFRFRKKESPDRS